MSDSSFVTFESINSEDTKVEMTTLHELTAPNLEIHPFCIIYPALDQPLKLNSSFLILFPKFYGLPGENPYGILMNSLLHVQPCNV